MSSAVVFGVLRLARKITFYWGINCLSLSLLLEEAMTGLGRFFVVRGAQWARYSEKMVMSGVWTRQQTEYPACLLCRSLACARRKRSFAWLNCRSWKTYVFVPGKLLKCRRCQKTCKSTCNRCVFIHSGQAIDSSRGLSLEISFKVAFLNVLVVSPLQNL